MASSTKGSVASGLSTDRRTSHSVTNFAIDNVTYDAILASSSKNLKLTIDDQNPSPVPLVDDARTPPNSPSKEEPAQSFGSLLGASVKVMAENDGK